MTEAIQAKMNHLAFQMETLRSDLANDPSMESQYCQRQIGTCIATLNMNISNMWGKKLVPIELVPAAEPAITSPKGKAKK